MKPIFLAPVFLLAGCVATHERPMNESEATLVSNNVLAMVDEAGGTLDIREKENVRCRRIRLTGSHLVTRLCYTTEEEEKIVAETQEEYYKRFGPQKCLSRGTCAGN